MSNFANLPSNVGLPSELVVNTIDPVIPPECKSNSIRVYATNSPNITTTFTTGTTPGATLSDISFPMTDILFDIPTSMKNVYLDTRLSTINFRVIVTPTGTSGDIKILTASLRSSAYAYFDSMKVQSQSGGLLEYWPNYDLCADTLIQGQMSNSDRAGLGMNLGFNTTANIGHTISNLATNAAPVSGAASSYSYSVPLLSSVLGVTADKFFPLGLTRKMLLSLTTSPVLPFTIVAGAGGTTATTIQVQLTDFWLSLETIDIGNAAQDQILRSLSDGKMYLHGQTWKTTSSLLPAATVGLVNLPVGLTGSSVRSLFARFAEGGAASTANASHGKFDSKGLFNQYGWNIGGVTVPSSLYNPLLYPSQAFRSFQMALGQFNSSQFKSGILPSYYCKLLAGGATTGNGSTQDSNYSSSSAAATQCCFILGENIEQIPKRGMLSGRDLTFQKVNLTLSTPVANTNPVTVYVHAILDTITIVDVNSGEVVTIL